MLINTHISFAEELYEDLKIDMPELNRSCFIYGNVKPDIVYRLSRLSHTYKELGEAVLGDVEGLIRSRFRTVEQVSVDLGVICHFLCDFFCKPHFHDNRFNNIIEHLAYERKLHIAYSDYIRSNLKKSNSLIVFHSYKPKDILDSLIDYYNGLNESYDKDIECALLACKTMVRHIINELKHIDGIRIPA